MLASFGMDHISGVYCPEKDDKDHDGRRTYQRRDYNRKRN